jgi:hypothetical protein
VALIIVSLISQLNTLLIGMYGVLILQRVWFMNISKKYMLLGQRIICFSVRNLLTDRVYESFMFWIKAYQRAGLKNKLENITISNVQFVALDMDKFYESITVRIYASSLDYVEDSAGRVKGGSSKRARSFSEYWTFIRRTGVEKDVYDFSTCPNCGAPADKMGQAGVCEYCGTKISNGDFSWVLAVITQDEVYSG